MAPNLHLGGKLTICLWGAACCAIGCGSSGESRPIAADSAGGAANPFEGPSGAGGETAHGGAAGASGAASASNAAGASGASGAGSAAGASGTAGGSGSASGGVNGGSAGASAAGAAGAAGKAGTGPSAPRLYLGILPDYDNAKANTNGLAGFVSRTGVVPYLASNYMNVSSGSFSTAQAKSFFDEALAAGVKVAAVSLATGDAEVPPGAQAQIAAAVAYGEQIGVTVQIRFGYEMNGNWSPSYHGGDPAIFKHTWAQVASAVHGAGGSMVWAPNIVGGPVTAYETVLPSEPSSIDVVGLDFYHFNSSETNLTVNPDEVDHAFATIYPLVKKLGKPFVLTETAVSYFVTSGAWPEAMQGPIAEKLSWLEQLTSPALLAKYPLFSGFVWFDYNKHENNEYRNFSISQQPSEAMMFSTWVSKRRSLLTLGG